MTIEIGATLALTCRMIAFILGLAYVLGCALKAAK